MEATNIMTDSFEIILDGDSSDEDEDTPNHGYNLRRTVQSESAAGGGGSSQTTPAATTSTSTRISQLNNHYLARLIRMFARNRDEDDDDGNAAAGTTGEDPEVLYNLTSESSDDDDTMSKFWPIRRLPKKPPKPCPSAVEALQKTDFYYETSQELGPDLEDCHRFKVQHNMLNLLQNREVCTLYIIMILSCPWLLSVTVIF